MTSTTGSISTLKVIGIDERIDIDVRALIVAGYTGRDSSSVRQHIEELAEIGVAPPPDVPMMYRLDPALLTTRQEIAVRGTATTGEVEPVLVRHATRWYLGLGSDHTDRELERAGVELSKAACPKPMGDTVFPISGDVPSGDFDVEWDHIGMRSWVDSGLYQEGSLSEIIVPSELVTRALQGVADDVDIVIFCGTVPLLGHEFRSGGEFSGELVSPDAATLSFAYTTHEIEEGKSNGAAS